MNRKATGCLALVLALAMAASPVHALMPSGGVGSIIPKQTESAQPEEESAEAAAEETSETAETPEATEAAAAEETSETAETPAAETAAAEETSGTAGTEGGKRKGLLAPSGGIGSIFSLGKEESGAAEPETAAPEPAAAETTAAEPVAAETTAAEPAAAETTAPEPAAVETTAAEPVAAETTASEPTAVETTAAEPAVTEPAAPETTASAESSKEASYRRALEFMEAGNYDMAISILEMLGDYSDSMVQLALAKNGKLQVYYDSALKLMNAGQYDAAREVFVSLGDFRDSSVQAVACEAAKKQQQYDAAAALEASGDLEAALQAFRKLGDFSDSASRAEALELEQKAAAIEEALEAEPFSETRVQELLQDMESANPAEDRLAGWKQRLQDKKNGLLFGENPVMAEADLDGDGVAERVLAQEGSLLDYRLLDGAWTPVSRTDSGKTYTSLLASADSSGRVYLRAEGEEGTDICLYENEWKTIASSPETGENLQWQLTDSGFLLTVVTGGVPQRRQVTEYIVLTADSFFDIPSEVEVDWSTYPEVTDPATLVRLYQEACLQDSLEEMDFLKAAGADVTAAGEWLRSAGELQGAERVLWDPFSQLTVVRAFSAKGEYMLAVREEEGGLKLAGGMEALLVPSEVQEPAPVISTLDYAGEGPQLICLNAVMEGSLYYNEESGEQGTQTFRVHVPAAGELTPAILHDYADSKDTFMTLTLIRPETGQVLWSGESKGKDADVTGHSFFLDAGEYSLSVALNARQQLPYRLTLGYVADENVEREENASYSDADTVPLNTEFRGSFAVDDDRDFYQFTLEEPGAVTFHHLHEYMDSTSTYYRVEMYSAASSDALLFRQDIDGRTTNVDRSTLYLPEGTYYLVYGTYSWSRNPYTFRLEFTPQANIEREWNNTYATATPLVLNQTSAGALMNDEDVDYYSFTLEENSRVQLQFDFEYFDNGSTFFRLYLDTEARNDTRYLALDRSGRDSATLTSPFWLGAGTYYLQVAGYHHTTRPYTLGVLAEADAGGETEWNNTYATADIMMVGQPMKGALRYDDDVDYYVFTVEQSRTLTLRFQHEWFDGGGTYFQVYLDAQPNNSQRLLDLDIRGKDGDVSAEPLLLEPGTYYLCVEDYHHTIQPYTIWME